MIFLEMNKLLLLKTPANGSEFSTIFPGQLLVMSAVVANSLSIVGLLIRHIGFIQWVR